jgi:hypothetical protein
MRHQVIRSIIIGSWIYLGLHLERRGRRAPTLQNIVTAFVCGTKSSASQYLWLHLKGVEADAAPLVDVGVVDGRHEPHLGGLERIPAHSRAPMRPQPRFLIFMVGKIKTSPLWELHSQVKDSALVGRLFWPVDLWNQAGVVFSATWAHCLDLVKCWGA